MNKIFIIFCFCLFVSVTSYCNASYTIQIAATKNPTNINWFAAKYNIDLKIVEIKEDGWYKYVIGEFETESAALNYISENLQSKGLKYPFPRTLPDPIVQESEKKAEQPIISPAKQIENDPATLSEKKPVSEVNTITTGTTDTKTDTDINDETLNLSEDRLSEENNPWANWINYQNLRKAEIAIINGAKPFLPRAIIPYYIRMVDKAIRFPIILFFLMLILLFILNAIVIMVILEISNTIKNRIERFDELYLKMYERALTGYIFQEYDLETTVNRIKRINRPRNRKILISVLFNFQKNLSGDLDQKILDIFSRLKLYEDAKKKTKSRSFYQQIIGIRELTNLYSSGALPIIETHINDDNDELRAEAQTSYVRLNQKEPFYFIRKLKKPFTRWSQLTSFYLFKLHKLPAPDFSEYLKSELYNVQNFSLRMITHFQQKENAEEIMKLLQAERSRTRFLAIRAISDLGIHEASQLLKERFEKETYYNKLEIVKALLHIGDDEDFDFLETIIRGQDVSLKIEACRSMYFMNSLGMENMLRLNEEKELALEPYIAHIYDPRN